MKIEGLLIIPNQCRGCRSCQLACSYAKHGVFNPAKSVIVLERDVATDHTAPVILPLGCDLCGGEAFCVRACPYGAIVPSTEHPGCKILVQA
jgi:carbon-monoxide dehydrogenase iron sulfur subunit